MRKSQDRIFRSVFADHIVNFVKMRKGLGYKCEEESRILFLFDQYAFERSCDGPLTQELALEFANFKSEMSKSRSVRFYQTIRKFADYLAVFQPDTPPLHPKALRYHKTRPPVHIYTEEELIRLLQGAKRVSRINPVRGITLHAMVGLASSTGMRVGEIVRLDRGDVNLDTGILTIRQTKFQKDRLVPVHPTTLKVLRDYAVVRDAHFPDCASSAFFINMWRRRFSKHTLSLAFYNLACSAGLRETVGYGPHFHDLRHTFAVRRLVAWYREGKDIQAMLPLLATYMGHVHFSDTAYYLTATPELLGLAADRYFSFLKQGEDSE